MVGSAVATTVASRPIMNPASEPTISVTRGRRDEPVADRGSPARAAGAGLVVRAVILSSSMRDFRFHIEDEEGPRERTPEMPLRANLQGGDISAMRRVSSQRSGAVGPGSHPRPQD